MCQAPSTCKDPSMYLLFSIFEVLYSVCPCPLSHPRPLAWTSSIPVSRPLICTCPLPQLKSLPCSPSYSIFKAPHMYQFFFIFDALSMYLCLSIFEAPHLYLSFSKHQAPFLHHVSSHTLDSCGDVETKTRSCQACRWGQGTRWPCLRLSLVFTPAYVRQGGERCVRRVGVRHDTSIYHALVILWRETQNWWVAGRRKIIVECLSQVTRQWKINEQ